MSPYTLIFTHQSFTNRFRALRAKRTAIEHASNVKSVWTLANQGATFMTFGPLGHFTFQACFSCRYMHWYWVLIVQREHHGLNMSSRIFFNVHHMNVALQIIWSLLNVMSAPVCIGRLQKRCTTDFPLCSLIIRWKILQDKLRNVTD